MFADTTWVAAVITHDQTARFVEGDGSVHVEQSLSAGQTYLVLSVSLQEPILLTLIQHMYPGCQYIGTTPPRW